MKLIDRATLDALSADAAASPRRRRNLNLHPELADPIQRLCNAVEPGSYVRPHHHAPDRWELFTVLRGAVRLLTFTEGGQVLSAALLGPGHDAAMVELPGGTWHSLVSLEPGTVFFEVKPGPYSAAGDKDFAIWAPGEGAPGAADLEAWMRHALPGTRWPGI
ncbi:WbuC family cupin fold metalloprotein [Novispirillum sp. DQ9]|uniref:WbuC family cupin fold metalloprotein n=1 Tax=Novispirillum sp. DQ9 TaxID=3398612 RepID=UPI003C7CE069